MINSFLSEKTWQILKFLIHSNIYIAIGWSSIVYFTLYLFDLPLNFLIIFIVFTEALLIFNLNRLTDKAEDEINTPQRASFVAKQSSYFFIFSLFLCIFLLLIVLFINFNVFLFVLVTVIIGICYSVLRIKKIFLLKNVLVAIVWGVTPLIVGLYYNIINYSLLSLIVFFSLQFFINNVMFDIKDMKGDKIHKIKTLPNTIGIKNTKIICYCINIFLVFFLLSNIYYGFLPIKSIILFFFICYVFMYLFLENKIKKDLYYGLLIDGEFIFLTILIFLVELIWY
ncbi:MAG: UbiA family prenyltransferase [Candidatus Aenigmarchaeota archaeon]|nr:UbiA family prenyltransferase [Candidatus Aenigmarchaeota archaeon]